jgi:mannose-6-phosphate isomerase
MRGIFMDILFLTPVFKERIWGGQKLTQFGYHLPYQKTGECWAISAHPNGESMIKEGRFKGLVLSQVFKSHKELFNHIPYDRFPLLTKILDANDDLSVQVHPDDEYALKIESDLGKTECWYVLDAEDDAYIIYGHHATSKEAFKNMIDKNQWHQLLIKKPVKKGDFIYVPSGTIHALGKGILILETQQSSDTTYRLYDYDRLDDKGNLRELHIEKSIEVSKIPHQNPVLDIKEINFGTSHITHFVGNQFFTVQKWVIHDHFELNHDYYKLFSVIGGSGSINGEKISKGDHFIVCANVSKIDLKGNLELIVSWA